MVHLSNKQRHALSHNLVLTLVCLYLLREVILQLRIRPRRNAVVLPLANAGVLDAEHLRDYLRVAKRLDQFSVGVKLMCHGCYASWVNVRQKIAIANT